MAVRDYVAKYIADLAGYKLEPAIRDSEKLEDASDQTARALDQNADKIGRSSDELRRSSDRTADDVVADWKRMDKAGDDAAREIDRSSDKIDRSFDDLGQQAGEAGHEAGAEFAMNLGSALSSGDTSAIVTDSAGGLIGSLATAGPLGIAAAAGGTIALSIWNSFQAKTTARREAVLAAAATIYQGLLDQGAEFAAQYERDVLRTFFDPTNTDQLVLDAREAGEALHDDLGQVIAGGPDSIDKKIGTLRGSLKKLKSDFDATTKTDEQRSAYGERKTLYDKELAYLSSLSEGWDTAQSAARNYNRVVTNLSPAVRATLRPGARDAGQVPYSSGGRG